MNQRERENLEREVLFSLSYFHGYIKIGVFLEEKKGREGFALMALDASGLGRMERFFFPFPLWWVAWAFSLASTVMCVGDWVGFLVNTPLSFEDFTTLDVGIDLIHACIRAFSFGFATYN